MASEFRSGVERARRTSCISLQEACAISGVSRPTYIKQERDPRKFTVAEFFGLYRELEPHSQEIMLEELYAVLGQGKVADFDFCGKTLGDLATVWAFAGERGRRAIESKLEELKGAY